MMTLYNEAKYLEPPLPFRSFVRHISKHLPREVQITLMTREITNISELENMLDILQNIGERDIGRRPNTPVVPHHNNNNNNFHHNRGTQNFHRGARGGSFDNRGESWRCRACLLYTSRCV